jgi:hypothetical protein
MPSRKKYTMKSDLIQGILDAELSPLSKKSYLSKIRKMLQETNKSLFYILTHPPFFIQWIREWSEAPATQKSFIAAILAVFRHNEGMKTQESKAYTEWFTVFSEINTEIDDRYKRNEPSDRQKEGFVAYPEIVAMRDTLKRGSDDRLLLSFYTYLPPLRCDFNRMRIYERAPPPSGANGGNGGKGGATELNYLVLPPVGPNAGAEAILVLGEFKTRNHRKDPFQKALPAELIQELRASLEAHPRVWVFTDRNGDPYSAASYTKWANRVLLKLFERPLTISLIRHSFINTLDFNKLTVADKEAIAKDMAHTVEMQDKYRLIFKTEDHKSGREEV